MREKFIVLCIIALWNSLALAQQPPADSTPPSIFGPPEPVEVELSAQGSDSKNGNSGVSTSFKATNQWGTVGVMNMTQEKIDGRTIKDFGGGIRFLPAPWIPFLQKYPDLLDVKFGGKWRDKSASQAWGGYTALRINPMGKHYLKLRFAHEESTDESNLNQRADLLDAQYRVANKDSWIIQRLHLGKIVNQAEILGLYSHRRDEATPKNWKNKNIAGLGLNLYLPGNNYVMGGVTDLDDDETGISKMLSFGHYRPTHGPEPSLPLYYFGSYKWDDVSDFLISGISFGGSEEEDDGKRRNQLVKPAQIGMMYGLFTNAGGLVDLRDIRRLEELTSRYGTRTQEIGKVTLLFAYLDVDIRDSNHPQFGTGHQGFGDVELYLVPTSTLLGLKEPFVSASYEWEDNVGFDYPKGFTTDRKERWTVGTGARLPKNFYFTMLAVPKIAGSSLTIEEVHAELYFRFSAQKLMPSNR